MLSHVNEKNEAAFVDVSAKAVTKRTATASATVHLPAAVLDAVKDGEIMGPKGPVLQTARIAAIMAVKQTPALIPMCHPLPIEGCDVHFTFAGAEVSAELTVSTTAKTGVEMEALTGASVAALTIYDMCKALSHEMVIGDIRLVQKQGGKRDVRR
jgi:cyclic pyranopterin monophosphate synthase